MDFLKRGQFLGLYCINTVEKMQYQTFQSQLLKLYFTSYVIGIHVAKFKNNPMI